MHGTTIDRRVKKTKKQLRLALMHLMKVKFPTIAGGKAAAPVSSLHKCMACGSGLSRRPSKKKGQFWWGCSNFPTCKQTYPDLKGRPDYSKGRNGQASE